MKENQPSGMPVTRRSVLFGALTTAAIAISSKVSAQEMQKYLPPRVQPKPKGPLVFLDYDKEEIDLAYDQAPWAPNAREISKRNAEKSATAIARLGEPVVSHMARPRSRRSKFIRPRKLMLQSTSFCMGVLGGLATQEVSPTCPRLSSMPAHTLFP
jgi:hypothetical protein